MFAVIPRQKTAFTCARLYRIIVQQNIRITITFFGTPGLSKIWIFPNKIIRSIPSPQQSGVGYHPRSKAEWDTIPEEKRSGEGHPPSPGLSSVLHCHCERSAAKCGNLLTRRDVPFLLSSRSIPEVKRSGIPSPRLGPRSAEEGGRGKGGSGRAKRIAPLASSPITPLSPRERGRGEGVARYDTIPILTYTSV